VKSQNRSLGSITKVVLKGAVPLVAASLALTACGGGGSSDDSQNKGGSSSSSPSTPPPPPTWPLTGEVDSGATTTAEHHPVLIAKIDNTSDSEPQYGLGKADMVTEELVEGGITRLAVFFYSDLPAKVGPIRSMRLTDIGIAKPIHARLVTSGAASVTLHGLHKAGVKYYDMENPAIVRDYNGTHDYLHSVIADLKKLGATSAHLKNAVRPRDYMPWGSEASYQGKKLAGSIDATFSSYRTDEWKYRGGKYVLENNYEENGDVFYPDTVIACYVTTSMAPYKDPAGNPVPVSHFTGHGKALIFHDGKVEKATWVKKGEGKTVTFQTSSGAQVKVPAGKVWLELIPQNDGGHVTWKAH